MLKFIKPQMSLVAMLHHIFNSLRELVTFKSKKRWSKIQQRFAVFACLGRTSEKSRKVLCATLPLSFVECQKM